MQEDNGIDVDVDDDGILDDIFEDASRVFESDSSDTNEKSLIVSTEDIRIDGDSGKSVKYDTSKERPLFNNLPMLYFDIQGVDDFIFLEGKDALEDFLFEVFLYRSVNKWLFERKGISWDKIDVNDKLRKSHRPENVPKMKLADLPDELLDKIDFPDDISYHRREDGTYDMVFVRGKGRDAYLIDLPEDEVNKIESNLNRDILKELGYKDTPRGLRKYDFLSDVNIDDFLLRIGDKDDREEYLSRYNRMLRDAGDFIRITYYDEYGSRPELKSYEFLQSYDKYDEHEFDEFFREVFDKEDVEVKCEDINIAWDKKVRICDGILIDDDEKGYIRAEPIIEIDDIDLVMGSKKYPSIPDIRGEIEEDFVRLTKWNKDVSEEIKLNTHVGVSDEEIDEITKHYKSQIENWAKRHHYPKSRIMEIKKTFDRRVDFYCFKSVIKGKRSCVDVALLDISDKFDRKSMFRKMVENILL